VDRLFQTLIRAACACNPLEEALAEAQELHERKGPPPEWAWPEQTALRRQVISAHLRGKALTSIAGGTVNEAERGVVERFIDQGWPETLRDLLTNWNDWRGWIAASREAVPGVAPSMDLPTQPQHEKWTHCTLLDLNRLESACAAVNVGEDGRGLWRHSLPADFRDRRLKLGMRIEDLRVVEDNLPGSGEQPIASHRRLTDEERKKREEAVRSYIRDKRAKDVPLEQITRDGIANALGLSGGFVSTTEAWTALSKEKDAEKAKERPSPEDNSISDAIERGDWDAVLKEQERSEDSPTRFD
jgi:hypothetical protein